jgi:hypothetical protein
MANRPHEIKRMNRATRSGPIYANHLQVTLPAVPLHQSGLLLTDIAQPAISRHNATIVKPDLITRSRNIVIIRMNQVYAA